MPQSECISGVWCFCVYMCGFVLAIVMEAGRKRYFKNISLKRPSVLLWALVGQLIPSYCWLTEGYMDTGAGVDVAVLAG